jgi:alanine racemase
MIDTSYQRPTWAEVSLEDLIFNFNSVKRFVGDGIRIMAVVKADAYGHGAAECATALENANVDWLSVALLEEALELRDNGITVPILVLGGVWSGQEEIFVKHSLTPVLYRPEIAESLNLAARNSGSTLNYHLKIDTGMGRVGIDPASIGEIADHLSSFDHIRLDGVMTHFAVADDLAQRKFTQDQIRIFAEAVETLHEKGFRPNYLDMANSPGAVAFPESRGNLVRIGGALYGLGDDILPAGIELPDLKHVMSLRSKIAFLKEVSAGVPLGYGLTYVTRRPSKIATIPIGYHDGYRRGLSGRAMVIVNGHFAPVVGRISMDWTLIDVTDVPNVKVEDVVTLIGEDGNKYIPASELSGILDTISYEVTCGISARVPRLYPVSAEKFY